MLQRQRVVPVRVQVVGHNRRQPALRVRLSERRAQLRRQFEREQINLRQDLRWLLFDQVFRCEQLAGAYIMKLQVEANTFLQLSEASAHDDFGIASPADVE